MSKIMLSNSMSMRAILFNAAIIIFLTFLSTVSFKGVVIASHVADGFDCSVPAKGGNKEQVDRRHTCGIPAADGLRLVCGSNIDLASFGFLICTTNKYNNCPNSVCLVRGGDTCANDIDCEGGTFCDQGTKKCTIDKGDDLSGTAGSSTTDIRQAVRRFLNVALGFLAVLTVLMIIYGGLMWLTAMGNDDKVSKGRQILMWAAIGAVVISIAWTISSYILTIGETVG